MKKLVILFLSCIVFLQSANCQPSNPDFVHSIGKIYVVVAVIAATFIGIVIFLISLDRKLTKLENQINSNER